MTDSVKKAKLDLRERVFSRGMNYPSNPELLMLILGAGSRKMPVEDIAYKMCDVIDRSAPARLVDNLMEIHGVGLGKAMAVAAALEFGRRRMSFMKALVQTPEDLLPFIQQYAYKKTEHFITVSLSGGHEILDQSVISVGNSTRTIASPREVFYEAVLNHASAVIVAHNHPSGNFEPSDEDIATTRRLSEAAEVLGVSLLDHIIIARSGYFSFKEHNLLKVMA